VSLRARLLLALGAVAITSLAVADVAIYSSLHASLFNQVEQSLTHDASQLLSVGPPGGQGFGLGGPFDQRRNACPESTAQGGPLISSDFVAHAAVGSPAALSECPAIVGGHSYLPKLPKSFTGFTPGQGGTEVTYLTAPSVEKGGPDFEVRVLRLPNENELLVGAPITDTENTLHHLFWIELGVTLVAVLAALAAGWWLVRLGLRPLTAVERTAEDIAAGDLQQRVPHEDDRTEVGRLAKALNVMLGRIESAFAARVASEERLRASDRLLRQFVGDASHELRTPIAAVSAYAELFERGAAGNEADLARVMAGIRSETARMERLVADLLTLARLDEGQPMEHTAVELVTLCAEAVQTARTVAPEWPIALEASRPVEVSGDPHRLRQVVDNLLSNVRSHTQPGTPARVVVDIEGDEAVVVVSDQGPGLPAEQASRVFERFFRSDPSRSRAHGGAGLGLSIVEGIVEAHHGSVSASSAPGAGMTITLRLPVLFDETSEPGEAGPDDGAEPAPDGAALPT